MAKNFSNELSKKESIFLSFAGFTVKVTFQPTELTVLKESLANTLRHFWLNKGYISKKRKADFEVIFVSDEKTEILVRGKKHYYLISERDFKNKKIYCSYYIGPGEFEIVLREITRFLVKKNGFLLHASSVLNKNKLLVFLARSGGGKTTAANMISSFKGSRKFSDDSLVVKKEKGKWVFYSTPFVEKNKIFKKSFCKSAKMFILKKNNKAAIKKSEGQKNLKFILAQIWLREKQVDKDLLRLAMEFAHDNDFYILQTSLQREKMRKVVNEA
jgi:hypothetical protein